MKTSNITLTFALALAACGGADHDDLDHVVWSATNPPGARAEIDADGALLLEMGGPDFCASPPCGPVTLEAGLPEGDFQLRFEGVSLMSAGEIGAHVTVDDYYVTARFNHWSSGDEGVTIDVLGEEEYRTTGYGTNGHSDTQVEFTLVREGDQLTAWTKYTTTEETDFATVGRNAGTLTLYLEPEEDVASTDSLGARIARRALSGPVASFADDVIEE
ncbi:MAG TPA: hypothetical protein VIG06_08425 [Kofleriaceae bacterium]|jgi:hypothetical protein